MIAIERIRLPAMTVAAWRGAMVACVVFFTAMGLTAWRFGLDQQTGALRAALAALQQQLQTPPPASDAAARGPDFARRLPATASVDPVVGELQRASAAEGAAFLTVSSAPRAATVQTLGRTELSVGLRGTYPQLKAVLAQTLDRYPDLVVQRLTFKRLASPSELDARVDLLLLTGPRPASAAGR